MGKETETRSDGDIEKGILTHTHTHTGKNGAGKHDGEEEGLCRSALRVCSDLELRVKGYDFARQWNHVETSVVLEEGTVPHRDVRGRGRA